MRSTAVIVAFSTLGMACATFLDLRVDFSTRNGAQITLKTAADVVATLTNMTNVMSELDTSLSSLFSEYCRVGLGPSSSAPFGMFPYSAWVTCNDGSAGNTTRRALPKA